MYITWKKCMIYIFYINYIQYISCIFSIKYILSDLYSDFKFAVEQCFDLSCCLDREPLMDSLVGPRIGNRT